MSFRSFQVQGIRTSYLVYVDVTIYIYMHDMVHHGRIAGHVANGPITQRALAAPMAQLDFNYNEPAWPNGPVAIGPVDPSQV